MRGKTRESENRMRVRRCEPKDLGEVQQILEVAPEAAWWTGESLAAALEGDAAHFLVEWEEQGIGGFVIGRRAADEGEILNLAVRPERRRRGIGRALVERLMEIFAGEATARVFLEVRESNRQAIALYEQLGFRATGRREGYYLEPDEAALVLEAKLSSSDGVAFRKGQVG